MKKSCGCVNKKVGGRKVEDMRAGLMREAQLRSCSPVLLIGGSSRSCRNFERLNRDWARLVAAAQVADPGTTTCGTCVAGRGAWTMDDGWLTDAGGLLLALGAGEGWYLVVVPRGGSKRP